MIDAADLTRAYRSHGFMVQRRAQRLLGSVAEASEVVQDVFLSLFERPEQFAGNSNLTTFLYSMTTHACLNRLRNSRARERLQSERAAELTADDGAQPCSQEDRVLLRATLSRMPAELAQIAVYHFMDGMTQDEIAQVMGCSRRRIGNQLVRLQTWLAREEAAT